MKLFTFGYLHSSSERTFSELITLHVPIVDVRYSATSHKHEHTGEAISRRNGIVYFHIPELGNTRYLENLNGNFAEHVIEIANLARGLDTLYAIMMQHRQAAIFCACSDVLHCHRKVVAQEAHNLFGWEIVHLPTKRRKRVEATSALQETAILWTGGQVS